MEEVAACDILIVGAGMAGCISAMSLYRDFSIVLLEKETAASNYLTETLIASSKRIFRELDIENWFAEENSKKTYRRSDGSVSYWESQIPVFTDAILNPEGENFVVDKSAFLNELKKFIFQLPFPCLNGTIHSLQRTNDYWKVLLQLNDGSTKKYRVKKIIDASGKTAVVPRKLGIQRIINDKLICISVIADNPSVDLLCKTFADENGWWFFCPIDENRLQISYYTDSDLIEKERTKAAAFEEFLNENHVWKKVLSIERLVNVTFLGTHPANTSRLSEFSGSGWAAIGDSAMCFDPLSSQGSYKAMVTARQLSHLLKASNFINGTPADERMFHEQFNTQMESIWQHYQQHRNYYYQAAKKDSTFWIRRSVQETSAFL